MARDGCNLSFGASNERQPGYRGPTQVIERDADDTGLCARLAPGSPEPIRCPWSAVHGGQDDGAALVLRGGVERFLERGADRNCHSDGTARTLAYTRQHRGESYHPGAFRMPIILPSHLSQSAHP